jgi:hypothetical protein
MPDTLKNSPFLLLPLLAMLLSGCTIPGTDMEIPGLPDLFGPQVVQYEHDVLVIKSLQAIPAEVAPGQSTTIIATLQNKGSEKMPLSGIGIELYDYCPGLFKLTEANLPKGDIYPDQMVQATWKLKASEDVAVESTCPSDGMKVAVRYPYQTESIATIAFIDEAEMNRLIQEGNFGKKQSSVTVGGGPVKAYIEVRDVQPIPSNSGTTNIVFQVKNMGQGFVQRSMGEGIEPLVGWYSVGSSDKGMQKGLEECKNENGAKFVLIGGRSAEIPCTVDVPKKPVTEYTETITTSIVYNYEFRKSVMVKVKPKR